MFERKSIRDKIVQHSKITNLERSISFKQNRPNPNFGSGSHAPDSAGFSGETTLRKAGDGSAQHGIKFGNEWFYRTYTKSGQDEFDITELIGVEKITSRIFSQNLYSGIGWGITKDDLGRFTLEIDNAIIRKKMLIWEIVINQLRASNGTFIVGSSAKIAEGSDATEKISDDVYNFTFESESGTSVTQPFVPGDIICSRRFWYKDQSSTTPLGASTQQIVATVNDITVKGRSTSTVRITIDRDNSFGDPPSSGMEFIRVASSVPSRRGLIVFSADGNETTLDPDSVDVPFVDVYGNLETFQDFLDALGGDVIFIKVRLGRLDALTGNTDEYGLWTNTMYLVGSGIEGATNFLSGTRDEFDALTQAQLDNLHNGDMWIMIDEYNNLYIWDSDGTTQTSGELIIGTPYTITDIGGFTHDFTNVGAPDNFLNTKFTATGTTPTSWGDATLTHWWTDRTNETIATLYEITENIGADGQVHRTEKRDLERVWNAIVDSHAGIQAEADLFSISKTGYLNAYNALNTYLNTTLQVFANFTMDTFIIRSTWETKWGNYYQAYADIKEAIKTALDNKIQTDENGRMYKAPTTGTPGLFASGTHLGFWDAGGWKTYMDDDGDFYLGGTGGKLQWNAGTNALYISGEIHISNPSDINAGDINDDGTYTDDTTADQAITDASDAQDDATQALSDANDNALLLTDIALDSKITPVEKLTIKPLWDSIVAEKADIDTQADLFGVSRVNYDNDYGYLNVYLNTTLNVFGNMTTTTTITRSTWDTKWKNYYDEKISILQAIADASKVLADDAQDDATQAIADALDAYNFADSNALDIFTNVNGLIDKPPTTGVQSGLYLGSTHLGFFDGSLWKTYMSNTGNFYLGGTSGNLRWNGSALYISGEIHISNPSDINAGDINDDGTYTDDTTADSNALDIFTNSAGKIDKTPSETTSGLYLGSTHLGYYDGSNWKTYMSNTGNFYLGGTGGSLRWDGSALYIAGEIHISNESTVRSDLNVADGADVTLSELNGGLAVQGAGLNLTGTSSAIKSGKLAYDDANEGWWLGRSGGVPRFHFGNSGDTQYLKWDGSNLIMSGKILVASGEIFSEFELETNGYIHTVGKGSPLDSTDGVYIGYWASGTTQVFACGNDTKYLYYNASTGNLLMKGGAITTGTIIGSTIKTATSSDRVELIPTGLKIYDVTGAFAGQIQYYKNTTMIGLMGCSSSAMYITASAGMDIDITASDDLDLNFGDYIKLSNLPTSNPGTTGRLYTQTASQLGGSGTEKVVCIV